MKRHREAVSRLFMGLLLPLLFAFPCLAAVLTEGPKVEFTNGTQAVIRWRTDVATGSRVFFGESPQRMSRRADLQDPGRTGSEHSAVLPALAPGTKWFYTVGTARIALATNSFVVPGPTNQERAPPVVGPQAPAITVHPSTPFAMAPPTRETWGYLPSLQDHFDRHGGDFKAKDPDDYARMAWEFRQRARAEGYPTKVDSAGVMRVYDPKSGAFAAYNRNGTTKTFFKPNSRDYFQRQPGELIQPRRGN